MACLLESNVHSNFGMKNQWYDQRFTQQIMVLNQLKATSVRLGICNHHHTKSQFKFVIKSWTTGFECFAYFESLFTKDHAFFKISLCLFCLGYRCVIIRFRISDCSVKSMFLEYEYMHIVPVNMYLSFMIFLLVVSVFTSLGDQIVLLVLLYPALNKSYHSPLSRITLLCCQNYHLIE